MIVPVESLLYVVAGFVITYVSLEIMWHSTVYRIKSGDKMIKPCLFKQVRYILVVPHPTQNKGRMLPGSQGVNRYVS